MEGMRDRDMALVEGGGQGGTDSGVGVGGQKPLRL